MDKFIEFAMLLDFYGGLLTEKQKLILSYYFEEDMSLGEISELLGTTRQAVHDIIKRSEKSLRDYEKELGLVEKFIAQKEKLKDIKALLKYKPDDMEIKKAIEIIDELIEY